ncbi:E3 ubiquitin-protein ligase HOS1 [Vitis vinifera]|uniref:E3 ubiquitin-protein ligase HOS1 n=1 Tax=Vitis vinifera TaxID=29760 RepID=A0A438ESC0_VITVI|nr:E3 ubiquitin-protein ligase HOS1 [Vitis vinifera]
MERTRFSGSPVSSDSTGIAAAARSVSSHLPQPNYGSRVVQTGNGCCRITLFFTCLHNHNMEIEKLLRKKQDHGVKLSITVHIVAEKSKEMGGVDGLKDFRPISLVESLYKLLAKVLANRLKKVVGKVISSSHNAFVEGRQIFDVVLITNEAIDSRLKSGSNGILCFKVGGIGDEGVEVSHLLFADNTLIFCEVELEAHVKREALVEESNHWEDKILEGHLVWGHPFEDLFPIFVHYSILKDAWVCDALEQVDNGGLWNPCFIRNFQDSKLGCVEALLLHLQGSSMIREVDDKTMRMTTKEHWEDAKDNSFRPVLYLLKEALEHLASIDLIELCNEAKVERCRATRDLSSCGRYVQHVLNSCGHASLCAECSQRCDVCPICRMPIPKNGNKLRCRLYYECIEAGLISKRYDDRFQEKDDSEKQQTADVQRLYSLFDVAMENNLVCLICHYVCMDESAVSSDPVIAFLLDEVVVKDWCKRTFRNIITELQGIYNLEVEEMKTRLSLLLKFSVQLAGVASVLEVLESSFKGTISSQLHDLHQLQESILKTKQHMEIMIWCIRHQFLENVRSRYSKFSSWRSLVRERKSAAIQRSWPDSVDHTAEPTKECGTLFIEDALLNLEIDQGRAQEMGEESEVASLQKDGGSTFFRSKIEGLAGCYPFENMRAAADILFLSGSSDLVVAKQAIAQFLYYLFDRHWTMPDEKWRHIVDDFAATFSITRHSLLESFTFYLLDDHTDEALQAPMVWSLSISGKANAIFSFHSETTMKPEGFKLLTSLFEFKSLQGRLATCDIKGGLPHQELFQNLVYPTMSHPDAHPQAEIILAFH